MVGKGVNATKSRAEKSRVEKSFDPTDLDAAKKRAFDAISRRPYAYHELLEKLITVGYQEDTSRLAVERVAELGYLDDVAYAKMFIEAKYNSGWGRRKTLDALRVKKVSAEHIEEALSELDEDIFSTESQVQSALRVVSRCPFETQKDRDRIIRRLRGKGFSLDCTYRVLELLKHLAR